MSISLKSDASGNSGSIQVAGVDRLTLNTDGSLVAGANPATGTRSMTLATMQKFADEFGASLATNGWQKLPSGLIIQWARNVSHSAGEYTTVITFPIAFPNGCLLPIATQVAGGGNAALVTPQVSIAPGTTGMNIFWPSGQNVASAFNWIAIGY